MSKRRNNVKQLQRPDMCIQCRLRPGDGSRFCTVCMITSERFGVPAEDDFGEDNTFLAAPELAAIGRELIAAYADFDPITLFGPSIDYLWKQKGGYDQGNPVGGKIQKPTGELKFYSGADFVIWVAADHCFMSNRFQITALVFHELLHIWQNEEKIRLELRGHDAEVFRREIEVFGPWHSGIQMLADVIETATLGQQIRRTA